MDNLAKQFNKVENNIIRYIYIKYIQPNQVNQVNQVNNYKFDEKISKEPNNKEIGESSKDSDNDHNEQSENEEEVEDLNISDSDDAESNNAESDNAESDNNDIEQLGITKSKNKSKTKPRKYKIQDPYRYTLFKKNIFTQKRSCAVISQEELIKNDIHTMKLADKAYERNPKEFQTSNFDIPPDVLRCSFIRKYHHRYIRCKNRISCDDSDVCKKHEECENIYLDSYNDLLETLGLSIE
jgi:hypothetical protein